MSNLYRKTEKEKQKLHWKIVHTPKNTQQIDNNWHSVRTKLSQINHSIKIVFWWENSSILIDMTLQLMAHFLLLRRVQHKNNSMEFNCESFGLVLGNLTKGWKCSVRNWTSVMVFLGYYYLWVWFTGLYISLFIARGAWNFK